MGRGVSNIDFSLDWAVNVSTVVFITIQLSPEHLMDKNGEGFYFQYDVIFSTPLCLYLKICPILLSTLQTYSVKQKFCLVGCVLQFKRLKKKNHYK